MDTVDSFWEMDSDKKLNRRSRWRWSDDNSSTFFLRKVELKKKVKSYIVPQLYSKGSKLYIIRAQSFIYYI
jgi:hypothetical protein